MIVFGDQTIRCQSVTYPRTSAKYDLIILVIYLRTGENLIAVILLQSTQLKCVFSLSYQTVSIFAISYNSGFCH